MKKLENQVEPTPTPLQNFDKFHDEGEGTFDIWEDIRAEFEGGTASVRSLATKYGINRNKINEKRKNENWRKYISIGANAKKKEAQTAYRAILGKTALRKIEEIKEELGKHYSPVDEPLIVVFAKNYERYIELEQDLADEGVVLYSLKTGGRYQNPTFTALQAVQKTLLTYANQLGLSMQSRKTLGISLGSDKNTQQSIFDFVNDINSMEIDI